jgi:hypothetical protein
VKYLRIFPPEIKKNKESLKIPKIRISKKKQTTQLPTEKVQKDKQSSTKHYKESKRSSNTNPTKNRG